MTGLEVFAFIRLWLPVATVGGLIIKAYFTTKNGITNWANKILDNHMAHIQDATEKASIAVIELSNYHHNMLDTQTRMLSSLESMSSDFHSHVKDDHDIQSKMLVSMEMIKERQSTILEAVHKSPAVHVYSAAPEEVAESAGGAEAEAI